jgi:SnoaL-like domain
MAGGTPPIELVARDVRLAFDGGDLELFETLLAPDVTWGAPDDPAPPCRNKSQVLAWYQKASASGARAHVREISIVGDQLLVGLVVSGTPAAKDHGGRATRWQVLSLENSKIVNIVGFAQKSEARAWMTR